MKHKLFTSGQDLNAAELWPDLYADAKWVSLDGNTVGYTHASQSRFVRFWVQQSVWHFSWSPPIWEALCLCIPLLNSFPCLLQPFTIFLECIQHLHEMHKNKVNNIKFTEITEEIFDTRKNSSCDLACGQLLLWRLEEVVQGSVPACCLSIPQ